MAAMILAKVGNFPRFDSPNKLLAYAGIFSSAYQSGQLKNCYPHMNFTTRPNTSVTGTRLLPINQGKCKKEGRNTAPHSVKNGLCSSKNHNGHQPPAIATELYKQAFGLLARHLNIPYKARQRGPLRHSAGFQALLEKVQKLLPMGGHLPGITALQAAGDQRRAKIFHQPPHFQTQQGHTGQDTGWDHKTAFFFIGIFLSLPLDVLSSSTPITLQRLSQRLQKSILEFCKKSKNTYAL